MKREAPSRGTGFYAPCRNYARITFQVIDGPKREHQKCAAAVLLLDGYFPGELPLSCFL